MHQLFNFFIIVALAIMIYVSTNSKNLDDATIDTSMSLSPLVETISDHFQSSMKEIIKKNDDIDNKKQMIDWVDFIWNDPKNALIKNQLDELKSNRDYEIYPILYITHMTREIMNELPEYTDDKHFLLDTMKEKLKNRLAPLETYLSLNSSDRIDIYTPLNQQLEELKKTACALPKYSVPRCHLRGCQRNKYFTPSYEIYGKIFRDSERTFIIELYNKPYLKKCAKFLFSFIRISASTACYIHEVPISFDQVNEE